MACFLAPMTAVIFTTVFRNRIPTKYHIGWLNMLLWGGVAGLALEHYAHQEIVPYFPYLSAMGSAAETSVMLQEIASIGLAMLLVCIAAWMVMVWIANKLGVSQDDKAAVQ